MFALVDCNSFYCSCESVFQPRLWGKPVVVLSNNDGCVIARSPEAKALSIRWVRPSSVARAVQEARRGGVSSNYELYGDLSARVMQVLGQAAAAIEVYSIDEAFLRLDGTAEQLQSAGRELRARVKQWTGIPVGVGIGATKVLAKLANRHAKKNGGVYVLDHKAKKVARSSRSGQWQNCGAWPDGGPSMLRSVTPTSRREAAACSGADHRASRDGVAPARLGGAPSHRLAAGAGSTLARSGPRSTALSPASFAGAAPRACPRGSCRWQVRSCLVNNMAR